MKELLMQYGTALATLFFLSVIAIIKYRQCKKDIKINQKKRSIVKRD